MNMNSTAKNILALISGLVIGSLVNMGLVNIGGLVVPVPEGTDVSTMEGLRASMQLFTPVNFLFPFLAHALGTLSGAFIAARIATSHQLKFALAVSVLFLIGGVTMVNILGGPMWFNVADLTLAYIPMGYLGWLLAGKNKGAH